MGEERQGMGTKEGIKKREVHDPKRRGEERGQRKSKMRKNAEEVNIEANGTKWEGTRKQQK